MGRSGGETRQRIVVEAYRLFYVAGFGRVRMEAIAAAAGVTKRTLYQHFDSKDALLAAALEAQQEQALALVQGWLVRPPENEGELIEAIFAGLGRWARRPRWTGSGYTRLAMELADLPGHPARRLARAHKRGVETWLAERYAALGAATPELRARETLLLLEGAMTLTLIHGDPAYAEAARRAARLLAQG
jgi:AcrR family transcriptional regulator